MTNLLYILIGLLGGFTSGSFGVGGGVVMVPLMVFLFGLTQHQAQGTALATILLPVGILGALRYYYAGNIKLNVVLLLALGYVFGSFLGANFIHGLTETTLKKAFGVFMILVGMKMAFLK